MERNRASGPLQMLRGAQVVLGALLIVTAPARGEVRPALPAGALAVPLFRQATPWSCGATVLQAVMSYWGVYDGGEQKLYAALQTTAKDGTEPPAIERVARAYGLEARLARGQRLADLRLALIRGDTVVLDIQAWRDPHGARPWTQSWDDGHYVVLVAMDATRAFVMDPSTSAAYAYLPLRELVERWHDFEDRRGFRQEYHQAAIYIHGERAAGAYPRAPVRLE